MKHLNFSNTSTAYLTTGLVALFSCGISNALQAEGQNEVRKPASSQRAFATPEEAIQALQTAVETNETSAMKEIFGSEFQTLLTGDKVQDANNAQRFAAAMKQGCVSVTNDSDRITLEIGTNNWPMPIPLVKSQGQWHFDTPAGREEIINRHIGKDELHAIGVCRAYVTAQHDYAGFKSREGGGTNYALHFKSTPGKKDGLYWPTAENEPASPFGALVAEAHAEGYTAHKGAGPNPFHGYYFKIITKQGKSADGGEKNYMNNGLLTDGFALLAYPENWDRSGVMTFIVNQDGKVYQQNLGEKTSRIAHSMKAYDPGSGWELVKDDGLTNSVSER